MANVKSLSLLLAQNSRIWTKRGLKQLHTPFIRNLSQQKVLQKSSETPLLRELMGKIRLTGPITVADYMREILLNPIHGYYIKSDPIGEKGDFITSPEISQIFGELLSIWCIDQWMKMGRPTPLQIVEFGPGKGTLVNDLMRVFSKFSNFDKDSVSLHLIEASPRFRRLQAQKLCGLDLQSERDEDYQDLKTRYNGIRVTWHRDLALVPNGFSCFVAHEFLDALPIHKLQKTGEGWREVLIDLDEGSGEHHLRYVLSRGPTPASISYVAPDEKRDHVEINVGSRLLVQNLSKRIDQFGGFALLVDYGHSGDKGDTFRAFKKHELFHPLREPGTADLTADVDFDDLRAAAINSNGTLVYGPISQGEFLKNMGSEIRIERLVRSNPVVTQHHALRSSYDMLVNPEKMGERFKMFAMYPETMKDILTQYPPSGFNPLN